MKHYFLACSISLFMACTHSEKQVVQQTTATTIDTTSKKKVDSIYYQKETTSEVSAAKIKTFLLQFLKNDLVAMEKSDRQFSFYEIDLNDDGLSEYFVKPESPYFCGSGGCSFMLLNHDFSMRTYFTVTSAPIFISAQKTNGWHDLILWGDYNEQEGVKNFIHLKFKSSNQKYPANPSLISKTSLAPSGHDFVMWHPEFSKAKIFSY